MALTTISRSGITAIIAGVLVIGTAAMLFFTQKEQQRELTRWQDKLNLIADSRARDVSGWVATQFTDLTALADNASLQVYFVTLKAQAADAEAQARPLAQADYLRNLLVTTAERLGFQPPAATLVQQSRANVRKLGTGGLALLDSNGKTLMATNGMPPVTDALAERINAAPRGKATLLDIDQAADGSQHMGFVVPVYSIQAEHTAASQIGMLVGIRPVDERLFSLLSPLPETEGSLEVVLVRDEAGGVRYLSPLRDQSPIMSQRESADDALAAAYSMAHPGSFAEKTDYRGKDVLVTGRAIANTPWSLVVKIDRSEALAESANWRHTMIAAFLLLMVAMVATIMAVWRHASARRAIDLSQQAERYAAESEARARLLSLVTDHQPEPLYIVDEAMRVWFTNKAAIDTLHLNPQDSHGKPLANVAGTAFAQDMQAHCATALQTNQSVETLLTRLEGSTSRHINVRFVPLQAIPVDGLDAATRGVLIAEQDISDLLQEREKRLHTLHQLIAMLVSLVDRRDPNAAQHSSHVATIAAATAREMGLDTAMVETTETAARLMNLGKIDVPAELLMRAGTLNPEERNTLRSSLLASALLLDGIEFEGPVADTLRQSQEHMDGSGPLHLKGNDILLSARIIAAANAAVGMLSPRAYRKALSIEEAVKQLQTNPQFDPKVIAALTNYLLNRASITSFGAADAA